MQLPPVEHGKSLIKHLSIPGHEKHRNVVFEMSSKHHKSPDWGLELPLSTSDVVHVCTMNTVALHILAGLRSLNDLFSKAFNEMYLHYYNIKHLFPIYISSLNKGPLPYSNSALSL